MRFDETVRRSPWSARVALVALGVVIGQWQSLEPGVEAQTRKVEAPQAFLSGSERCEIILKDMHKTLQTMDQRLMNLEQASQVLVNKK
jgi:hypothetical protein